MMSLSVLSAFLALAGDQAEAPDKCVKVPLAVSVSERPNDDVARPSGILSLGTTDWLFRPRAGRDLLGGKPIVGGDPTVGGVTLGDGSGLSLDRDCSGNRCIYTGVSRVARAEGCWITTGGPERKAGALLLGGGRLVVARKGKGSELRLVQDNPGGAPASLVLLQTASPVVGLSVSILSIHGGLRTFDVIRREAGGTLVLTTYVFDHKLVP